MRRRSFLAAIAAAFVAPDPEKLLWVPGKKVISVPPARKVELATPVAWQAIVEDVTTLSDPWRKYLVTSYVLHHQSKLCRILNANTRYFRRYLSHGGQLVVRFSDGSSKVVTWDDLQRTPEWPARLPAPSIIRDNVL